MDGETFTEEASELGIDDCFETGRGMTLLDANGDGELDIVYGNWNGPHRLMIKTASGYTNEATPAMAVASPIRTVIAADFDNDGQEELFMNNIPVRLPHTRASSALAFERP